MLKREETLMAFDYGEARVGVAVGNMLLQIPHPLSTISVEGMYPKLDQIAPLIARWQPQRLIVGRPSFGDDPQKTQLLNTINNFAKRLARKFNLAVEFVNEDFSSAEAASQLNEQGIYGRAQSGRLDQLAACAILRGYFAVHVTSQPLGLECPS